LEIVPSESLAFAVMATEVVAVTVALLAGEVMATVGGRLPVEVLDVSETTAEVVAPPVESVALAVKTCVPTANVPEYVYGVAVLEASKLDPSKKSTLVIVVEKPFSPAVSVTASVGWTEPEAEEVVSETQGA
jgi:predicted benzoate:H+ symporter BenE